MGSGRLGGGEGEGDGMVRSIAGKNCGGTAPEPRWRVVKSKLVFNECLTVPLSGLMSMSLSARMPGTAFACMFTRETREPGGMGGRESEYRVTNGDSGEQTQVEPQPNP